jgi:3-deoxy-D-manno-octulosonic-acid transferase
VTGSRGLPLPIRLWLAATAAFPSLLYRQARKAHRGQGADPARLQERFGKPMLARPSGALVWLHAASVGEVASAARLARMIIAEAPQRSLLVTTATATGAETVARLLPDALHQFLPVDTPAAVTSFLDHWHPDAALFIEADLWPRLLLGLAGRGCPMALINARASRSRARFPATYGALLSPMALITVQEAGLVPGLVALGLDPARIHAAGNLKADVVPPAVDELMRQEFVRAAEGRGLWAAVSTHEGEEEMVLDAHAALPGKPLLLLVPRHPARGEAVAALLHKRGVAFTRHSRGGLPRATTAVHLIDALGLTGTVYAAAGLAFVGGSLLPGPEGHTPHEPAAIGCAIVSGPNVANFRAAYRRLAEDGGAVMLERPEDLGDHIAALLADRARLQSLQSSARTSHAAEAGATEATLRLLRPILP